MSSSIEKHTYRLKRLVTAWQWNGEPMSNVHFQTTRYPETGYTYLTVRNSSGENYQAQVGDYIVESPITTWSGSIGVFYRVMKKPAFDEQFVIEE